MSCICCCWNSNKQQTNIVPDSSKLLNQKELNVKSKAAQHRSQEKAAGFVTAAEVVDAMIPKEMECAEEKGKVVKEEVAIQMIAGAKGERDTSINRSSKKVAPEVANQNHTSDCGDSEDDENGDASCDEDNNKPENNPMKSAYWRQRLKENPLFTDEGQEDVDCSDALPGGLENPDSYFNKTLLGLINHLRFNYKSPLQMLSFSPQLSHLAKSTWHQRLAITDGFGVVQECQISQNYFMKDKPDFGLAKQFDCLVYYDLHAHSLNDLPAAACFYWRSKTCYSTIAGRYIWTSHEEIPYPRLESNVGMHIESYRGTVRKVLLEEDNKYIGMYFKKGPVLFKEAKAPYCVTVVFADSDSHNALCSQ